MTSILYTPHQLVADSRTTKVRQRIKPGSHKRHPQRSNEREVVNDDNIKLYRFGDEDWPLDEGARLRFKHDIIRVAAVAGNRSEGHALIDNLSVHGDRVFDVYKDASWVVGDKHAVSGCTALLVGEKALHVVDLEGPRFDLDYQRHSLDEPFAMGSGGKVALFLHQMFQMPPALAVAAAGLVDTSTGGKIVTLDRREIIEEGQTTIAWSESGEVYRDAEELIERLTDYFSDWNVGNFPFTLPQFPLRKAKTSFVEVADSSRVKPKPKKK